MSGHLQCMNPYHLFLLAKKSPWTHCQYFSCSSSQTRCSPAKQYPLHSSPRTTAPFPHSRLTFQTLLKTSAVISASLLSPQLHLSTGLFISRVVGLSKLYRFPGSELIPYQSMVLLLFHCFLRVWAFLFCETYIGNAPSISIFLKLLMYLCFYLINKKGNIGEKCSVLHLEWKLHSLGVETWSLILIFSLHRGKSRTFWIESKLGNSFCLNLFISLIKFPLATEGNVKKNKK